MKEKFIMEKYDDEITLTNATTKEILQQIEKGMAVYTQFNEQLFDELQESMASEYKAAYEENKKDMKGFEVVIWKEESGIKYEW